MILNYLVLFSYLSENQSCSTTSNLQLNNDFTRILIFKDTFTLLYLLLDDIKLIF